MHEMGVAQQMADIALGAIPRDLENPRVARLNLRIGRLAAVVRESLTFCFEVIARGTALEGAELVIEDVPIRLRCRGCGNEWEVDGPIFTCPGCREGAVDLVSGRELEIVSLDLAD
jgi:hydrogenase nickel incorporation protein HypA/HybF